VKRSKLCGTLCATDAGIWERMRSASMVAERGEVVISGRRVGRDLLIKYVSRKRFGFG
jgi:hypothetical protein